jgi:hypothetical protein
LTKHGGVDTVIPPPLTPRVAFLKSLQNDALKPPKPVAVPSTTPAAQDPKARALHGLSALEEGLPEARVDYYFEKPDLVPLFDEIVRAAAAARELRQSAVAKFGDKARAMFPDHETTRRQLEKDLAAATAVPDGDKLTLVPADNTSTAGTLYLIRIDGDWKIDASRQMKTLDAATQRAVIDKLRRQAYGMLGVAARIEVGEVHSAEEISIAVMAEQMALPATDDK